MYIVERRTDKSLLPLSSVHIDHTTQWIEEIVEGITICLIGKTGRIHLAMNMIVQPTV